MQNLIFDMVNMQCDMDDNYNANFDFGSIYYPYV